MTFLFLLRLFHISRSSPPPFFLFYPFPPPLIFRLPFPSTCPLAPCFAVVHQHFVSVHPWPATYSWRVGCSSLVYRHSIRSSLSLVSSMSLLSLAFFLFISPSLFFSLAPHLRLIIHTSQPAATTTAHRRHRQYGIPLYWSSFPAFTGFNPNFPPLYASVALLPVYTRYYPLPSQALPIHPFVRR